MNFILLLTGRDRPVIKKDFLQGLTFIFKIVILNHIIKLSAIFILLLFLFLAS